MCSHQLLSLDSPGCVLQDRVHHLWRVQLPKLPENKDNKAALSLTSAEGGPPAITLEAHKVIMITDYSLTSVITSPRVLGLLISTVFLQDY